MTKVERQLLQKRVRKTQKRRSSGVNFERFRADRWNTQIWWRKARFSSWSSARERTIERKARSANRAMGMKEWEFGKEV
jgi:hypothetical protein